MMAALLKERLRIRLQKITRADFNERNVRGMILAIIWHGRPHEKDRVGNE
jgi:hypothetical protein